LAAFSATSEKLQNSVKKEKSNMATRRRKQRKHSNLGEVTKRDFVAIAKILCTEGVSQRTKQRFASYFGSENPRFNESRFLAATNSCRVG
jgi:hypothetical protein